MTMAPRHPGARAPEPFSLAGRAVRGFVFAAVSVLLAVAAHRLAGAGAPAGSLLWTCAAALVGVGWIASRRERSGRFLGALVIGNQAMLHLAFAAPALLAAERADATGGTSFSLTRVLLCHHGPSPVTSASLRAAASNMDPAALSALTRSASAASGSTASGSSELLEMVAMLTAHLVAAAVVAWWLRKGERLACAVLVRAARRLLAGAAPVLRGLRQTVVATVLTHSSRCVGAVAGRGPPQCPNVHPLLPA